MGNLSIINHPDFGQVRNVVVKGEPWFVAKDLCDVLGYANNRETISKLVDAEDRSDVTISDGSQNRQVTVVNESGLYSLILKSHKPVAKSFKRWVTSEVLPAIRKYGYYIMPGDQASRKERNAIERTYYKELRKFVTKEDVSKIARKCSIPLSRVQDILDGGSRDNEIMRLLQDCAAVNKDKWFDAYTIKRMDEVIDRLK